MTVRNIEICDEFGNTKIIESNTSSEWEAMDEALDAGAHRVRIVTDDHNGYWVYHSRAINSTIALQKIDLGFDPEELRAQVKADRAMSITAAGIFSMLFIGIPTNNGVYFGFFWKFMLYLVATAGR